MFRSPASGAALLAALAAPSWAAAAPPSVPVLDEIRIAIPGATPPPGAPSREVARCRVMVWITADGVVRAAQVIGSSGSARLDTACIRGVTGRRLEPAVSDAGAIDSWAVIPLVWMAGGSFAEKAIPNDRASPPIPPLASDQVMHVQPPFYPAGALARSEQGDCTVSVRISPQGHLDDLKITRSTGSPDLDAGCLAAIYAARFNPADQAGKPVSASTEVALHWQLP